MDFIKILGDIIQEQEENNYQSAGDAKRHGWTARRPADYSSDRYNMIKVDGFTMYRIIGGGVTSSASSGANASQSNNSSSGWSRVSSHSWKSGDKIDSPLRNPDKCRNYGQHRGSGRGYHNACDISVNSGTAIFAPHDGTFSEVDNSVCGNGIIIKGKDENGKELHSGFCHLRNREVPADGKVKKGDLIGFTGGGKKYGSNTEYEPGAGRSSGPHLHWTFKVGGVSTNPYTYN